MNVQCIYTKHFLLSFRHTTQPARVPNGGGRARRQQAVMHKRRIALNIHYHNEFSSTLCVLSFLPSSCRWYSICQTHIAHCFILKKRLLFIKILKQSTPGMFIYVRNVYVSILLSEIIFLIRVCFDAAMACVF